ncbi:Uncharacterised protein [Mycobacteroides abscessus subsp. massiliense]|nr:Uncharacterised protein [Mycobacteroides abscessus subsp. massiliense]
MRFGYSEPKSNATTATTVRHVQAKAQPSRAIREASAAATKDSAAVPRAIHVQLVP